MTTPRYLKQQTLSTSAPSMLHSHHLGSARQEFQDPVAKAGVKTQDPELVNKLSRHNCVECCSSQTLSTSRHDVKTTCL
uniref:Uncharacterized protein n=1 Tax=Anguilla anguilla TaxID=7936 RepID=A0A0E9RAR2_ANGAN